MSAKDEIAEFGKQASATAARIKACREELKALKRLYAMQQRAAAAEAAKKRPTCEHEWEPVTNFAGEILSRCAKCLARK